VTLDGRWLSSMWPKVRASLPPPPAIVVEVGCGPHGGFVPALTEEGYEAIGIDPAAPEADQYLQAEYERTPVSAPADAIVACTSLHHVADPAVAIDKIASDLTPGGVVVVIEYDWESFDEATARWCFARLHPEESDGWLGRQRQRWRESGQSWDRYFHAWAREHGLHGGPAILAELDRRFEPVDQGRGAYVFSELADTTEAEEVRAIDAGEIHPLRIDYVGRRR
jgi:SAM-dependent methyltransferase